MNSKQTEGKQLRCRRLMMCMAMTVAGLAARHIVGHLVRVGDAPLLQIDSRQRGLAIVLFVANNNIRAYNEHM